MSFRKKLACLVSASCVLFLTQIHASANPFGGIDETLDTVNDVNATINALDQAINGTGYTLNSLSDILGLNASDIFLEDVAAINQLSHVYEIWYGGLPLAEQETVAWLILELAQNEIVTLDMLSTSERFLQMSASEQSQVATTLFQLQSLVEATAQDEVRFLDFAACLNGGSAACAL